MPHKAAGCSSDTWLTTERLERLERKWREALQRGEILVRFELKLDEELERNPLDIPQSSWMAKPTSGATSKSNGREREAADLVLVCRKKLWKHF